MDPGEFSGLVSLDDLRPALPELVPPSPSLNAIEATQHRCVKDRAPNAYDQQQAAQRRASEIAMAQQQQAVMAQQTSPARVLLHRSPSSRYRCGDDIASMACGTRRDRTP